MDYKDKLNLDDIVFLKKLSKDLREQDNRMTYMPIYRIKTFKKIVGVVPERADYKCIYDLEYDLIYKSIDEAREMLLDRLEGLKIGDKYQSLEEAENDYLSNSNKTLSTLEDYCNFLIDKLGFEHFEYTGCVEVEKLECEFLTEKEALEYIKKHDKFKDAIIYVDSAWYNKSLVKLTEIISKFK